MSELPYRWDPSRYLTHSICGGASYLIAKSLLHPVDTIRARLMSD